MYQVLVKFNILVVYLVFGQMLWANVDSSNHAVKNHESYIYPVRYFYKDLEYRDYWMNVLSKSIDGFEIIRTSERAPEWIGLAFKMNYNQEEIYLVVREIKVKPLQAGSLYGEVVALRGDAIKENGEYYYQGNPYSRQRYESVIDLKEVQSLRFISRAGYSFSGCKNAFSL